MCSLCGAFESFIFDKTVENCASSTLANYRNMISYFIKFVGNDVPVSELQSPVYVKKYILHLQKRNLSGKTIHTYLKHIKVFYSWLVLNGFIEYNSIAEIRVKYEKKMPLVFSMEEISLLAGIDNLRDRLLVVLGLDCGLRKKEIIMLRVSDIQEKRIYVRSGKGRKDRFVPISPFTYGLIREYLLSLPVSTPYLFQQQYSSLPLTYSGLRCVFRRLKEKTGIGRLTPHLCRHTYGTYYIHSGGDMKVLQLLLGHSEIDTTEVYVHLSNMLDVGEYAKYSIINIIDRQK